MFICRQIDVCYGKSANALTSGWSHRTTILRKKAYVGFAVSRLCWKIQWLAVNLSAFSGPVYCHPLICFGPSLPLTDGVGMTFEGVCLSVCLFVCLFVCLSVSRQHNSTRRMAIANWTCVSWDHRGKCYMDRKRIQCLSNALQHVPIYLQPFLRYSEISVASDWFLTVFVSELAFFATFCFPLGTPLGQSR